MAYKATVMFTDSEDNDHRYNPGDVYPREGLEVSNSRIALLSSNKNLRGIPVIKQETVQPVKEPVQEPEVAIENPPKRRGRKRAD